MKKILFGLIVALIVAPMPGVATPKKINNFHWVGIDRVIAIGDLHGDYGQYISALSLAGLVDRKGKWIGGNTHLVQTGDIPDRGPDTKKILDHLSGLKKQAKKKGGYVHMLIGNHEAMNVIGDLRYVDPGEYQAFVNSKSSRARKLLWEHQISAMREEEPEKFDSLDIDAYRQQWEQQVPLGWIEHRKAWGVKGKYGKLILDNSVAVQINDTIFLHGGISSKYCRYSLESLTEQTHAALKKYAVEDTVILEDPLGPLWYRGLAQESEEGGFGDILTQILARYGASRIVVGHSPTGGIVWPRFDQRVIVNDTGLATAYGKHSAIVELKGTTAVAIYADQSLLIPKSSAERESYLRKVIEFTENNKQLKQRLAKMLAPPDALQSTTDSDSHNTIAEPQFYPDICQ